MINVIAWLSACAVAAGMVTLAVYLLLSFLRGFVIGLQKPIINREVARLVEARLTATPALYVGDRMIMSGAFLRQVHRMGDGERVPVEVFDIRDSEGTKELVLRNMPPRSGDAFWKDRA